VKRREERIARTITFGSLVQAVIVEACRLPGQFEEIRTGEAVPKGTAEKRAWFVAGATGDT